MHRRRFLQYSSLAGLGAYTGTLPALAAAPSPIDHAKDWAWLIGNWNVRHRRLRERLVGNQDWQEFPGKSAFWQTLGGLGNLDDNVVELPGDPYRGISLRAYDPATDTWAIWWLDGRNPTHIDPPVKGRFRGDTGVFIGHDTLRDKPIVMRFTWRDIHSAQPWWEQAFSGDEGRSWEVNWRNWFTRTAAQPSPLPVLADAPRDWNFLQGDWHARHRRLRDPFAASDDWETFDGTLALWPVLGGHGVVAHLAMHPHGGDEFGVRLHTHDAKTRQWLQWRLDGSQPGEIDAASIGALKDGAISYAGEEGVGGKRLPVRTTWSPQSAKAARRELAFSPDDGKTWKTWWTSDFTRTG
ncbi:MAG TPA: hypothetical protein VM687_16980 [Stenotrophomonas sp.]|nr:hypothetical protein [Stenotrophomonas sp.]